MTCFTRVVNWDVHLISWIKAEIIQNGKRKRRKNSYSLNNIHQKKKFFWSILWGGKLRFPGYGLRNKPKDRVNSAMQLLLFIRVAFASWIADLTENEHFRMSQTDLQAMAMCWTVLIQQAALLKTCTWVTVEAVSADTQNQQMESTYHSTGDGGGSQGDNFLFFWFY